MALYLAEYLIDAFDRKDDGGIYLRAELFGKQGVTIPAGAEYVSDPIAFHAAPLSSLAVTVYLKKPPARGTSHPGARADTYYEQGDHGSAGAMAGAWGGGDAEPGDAFTLEPGRLWKQGLRRQRLPLPFVSYFPDDPRHPASRSGGSPLRTSTSRGPLVS